MGDGVTRGHFATKAPPPAGIALENEQAEALPQAPGALTLLQPAGAAYARR